MFKYSSILCMLFICSKTQSGYSDKILYLECQAIYRLCMGCGRVAHFERIHRIVRVEDGGPRDTLSPLAQDQEKEKEKQQQIGSR